MLLHPFDLNSLSPPHLEKLSEQLADFSGNHPDMVEQWSLGLSDAGREITALLVTDRQRPVHDKQVVVVVCGRHGDETGAFAVALQLLAWLVSEEAAEIREHHLLIVVPCANPDGFVRGEFLAPRDALSSIEDHYVGQLVDRYRPDALIDVHSLGRGDLEAVISGHTSHTGEDDLIAGLLAARMIEGAEQEGYPFLYHPLGVQALHPWTVVRYNNFVCQDCFERCHAIVMGLEVNHFALSVEDAARSGLAVLRPFLHAGIDRFSWEPHPGYPNTIIKGNFLTSLRAAGKRPGDRRESRYEMWQNRDLLSEPLRMMPDPKTIEVYTKYSGEETLHAVSFSCRMRGRPAVREVYLNGSQTEFYTCEDDCSLYLFSDVISLTKGEYKLRIKFD